MVNVWCTPPPLHRLCSGIAFQSIGVALPLHLAGIFSRSGYDQSLRGASCSFLGCFLAMLLLCNEVLCGGGTMVLLDLVGLVNTSQQPVSFIAV